MLETSLLSVITINRNDRSGLALTLDSIAFQKEMGARIQSVVVDGNSSDGSMELIEEAPGIADLVTSEPDAGIYDAMNKGVRLANGDSILFLNSGDSFVNTFSVRRLQDRIDLGKTVVCGRCLQMYESDGYVRPSLAIARPDVDSFSHQAIFVPLELARMYPFDERYVISADTVWKRRVCASAQIEILKDVCTTFSLGGVSNDPSLRQVEKFLGQPGGIVPAVRASIKILLKAVVGRRLMYRILAFGKYDHLTAAQIVKLLGQHAGGG